MKRYSQRGSVSITSTLMDSLLPAMLKEEALLLCIRSWGWTGSLSSSVSAPSFSIFHRTASDTSPWAGMVTVRVTVFPVSLEARVSVVRVSLPSVLLMVKGICTVSPMMP